MDLVRRAGLGNFLYFVEIEKEVRKVTAQSKGIL